MSDKTPRVLTPEEQLLFTAIPDDLSAQELARYYTFSLEDKDFIFRHRGSDKRLGVALQLCTLRFPGRFLTQVTAISEQLVIYVAEQLNLPIIRHLLPFAMENDEALPLVDGAMAWIRQHKLIAPTILTTEKLVWHVQRIARWRVNRRITHTLSSSQEAILQNLLIVAADKGGQTPLTWLRMTAPKPSSGGMYHLLKRIAFVNDLQLPARPATGTRATQTAVSQRLSMTYSYPPARPLSIQPVFASWRNGGSVTGHSR